MLSDLILQQYTERERGHRTTVQACPGSIETFIVLTQIFAH